MSVARRLWSAAVSAAVSTAVSVAVLLATAASAVAAPDALRGEQVYVRCMACHALSIDRVGPHHCGLFGRLAGSVPGFDYSAAMKSSKIVWTEKTLDDFLTGPLKVVPGTSMTYDGVSDRGDRSDLIAYLRRANDLPECRSMRVRR